MLVYQRLMGFFYGIGWIPHWSNLFRTIGPSISVYVKCILHTLIHTNVQYLNILANDKNAQIGNVWPTFVCFLPLSIHLSIYPFIHSSRLPLPSAKSRMTRQPASRWNMTSKSYNQHQQVEWLTALAATSWSIIKLKSMKVNYLHV